MSQNSIHEFPSDALDRSCFAFTVTCLDNPGAYGASAVILFPDDPSGLELRYKIQETLFSVGYSTTNNISYKSYFPT